MLRQTGLSLLARARGAEATMRGPLLAATCQVNERGRGDSPSPPPSCRRKGKGFSSKRELRLRELAGGSRLLMLRAEGALQMFRPRAEMPRELLPSCPAPAESVPVSGRPGRA